MSRFTVIGLGQYGYQVARSLAALGAEVLAIDKEIELCQSIKEFDNVDSQCFDATNENALRNAGLEEMDGVVVATSRNFEVSVTVTALLKQIPVRRIFARASNPIHVHILREVGAAHVFKPELEMAARDARSIYSPDLYDLGVLPTGHHLIEIDARQYLWGKTLGELDFRKRFELNVIAIKRQRPIVTRDGDSAFHQETELSPSASDVIEKGDVLVLIGTQTRTREFIGLWQ